MGKNNLCFWKWVYKYGKSFKGNLRTICRDCPGYNTSCKRYIPIEADDLIALNKNKEEEKNPCD